MQNDFFNRLIAIMQYIKAPSQRRFAENIGISFSKFQSYQRGSLPGIDVLNIILSNIPEISPEWLISGTGEMIKKKVKQSLVETSEDVETLIEVVKNQKDEIQELKAMLKEKDKQLGELIQTNLMLLVREKDKTDALPDEAAKCADAG